MIHRFVHVGDLHLGPNARNEDRRRALDQILAENPSNVSAWLLLGDLNHGRSTIEDRNFLTERVVQMAGIAPVLVLYGNHDLPGDLDYLSFLAAFHQIYVIRTARVVRLALATGGHASIFCLPYPSRAGLVAAGVSTEQLGDEARAALDRIFMDAEDRLRAARERGDVTFMVGHINVGGSILSNGQPNIGREIELDPGLLTRFGRIPVLLNHIHRAQSIDNVWYAGSCCRLDWGEIDPKRYLVLHYSTDASWGGLRGDGPQDGVPGQCAWDVETPPLAVAPMYHVQGELSPEGFTWTCDDGGEAEQAGPGFFTGAEVRVRYTYNTLDKERINEELVRAPFLGAKRLDVEPIAVNKRAMRAPEVAAATTLEAKGRAFAREAGLQWTEGVAAKLALVQLPDGAEFLTEVHRRLSGIAAEGPEASRRSVLQFPNHGRITAE